MKDDGGADKVLLSGRHVAWLGAAAAKNRPLFVRFMAGIVPTTTWLVYWLANQNVNLGKT
jgi:hypothetical protein